MKWWSPIWSEARCNPRRQTAAQGLRKEIRDLAHRELDAMSGMKKAEAWAPAEAMGKPEAAEGRLPVSPDIAPWEPRRPGFSVISGGRSRR